MRTLVPLALSLTLTSLACGGGKEEAKAPNGATSATASTQAPSTTTDLPPNPGEGTKLEEKKDKKADPGRSPEEIRETIRGRREESRKCYDDQKKLKPALEGQVSVSFTIDVKGKVTEASLDSEQTTLNDEKVTSCLVTFVKTFTFPESPRGLESKIRYPFVFTRGRDEKAK